MRYVFVLMVMLMACSDGIETRKQRLLGQGNDRVQQHDYDQAQHFFEGAIKLDSCFVDAWYNLGVVAFKRHDFGTAILYYSRAIDCKPDYFPAYLNRANAFYEAKEYFSALEDLKTLSKQKDTVTVPFLRGLIHSRMGHYDEALNDFDSVLALQPQNREALVNKGIIFYYEKHYGDARANLERAKKLNTSEPNVYNTLALIDIAEGNGPGALAQIGKALLIKPDDAYYLNNRGYIYLMMDSVEHAISDIDQSISIDPYNAWSYRNKGIYFVKVKKFGEGVLLLLKALKMEPAIQDTHSWLAMAYRGIGDRSNALLQESLAKTAGDKIIAGKP